MLNLKERWLLLKEIYSDFKMKIYTWIANSSLDIYL